MTHPSLVVASYSHVRPHGDVTMATGEEILGREFQKTKARSQENLEHKSLECKSVTTNGSFSPTKELEKRSMGLTSTYRGGAKDVARREKNRRARIAISC